MKHSLGWAEINRRKKIEFDAANDDKIEKEIIKFLYHIFLLAGVALATFGIMMAVFLI